MTLIRFRYLLTLLLILSPLHLLAQSAVSNVRAIQEGRNVVLLYDLSKDAEIRQVKIDVNGRSRVLPMSSLSGDVGRKVSRGADRRIVYNVLEDYKDGLRSKNVSFVIIDLFFHKGHEYVDLGLSVKWATCNVGADSPEDYGDYFAWGETELKFRYAWDTYKWCKGDSDNLTKYCTDSDYGTVDNKTRLFLSHDAARANWGGSWRMPTHDEFTELRENCTWTWTTHNGVKGYKVTSRVNGNSIFLPAAGSRDYCTLYCAGTSGCYWSSSLYTDNPSYAHYPSFSSSDIGVGWCSSRERYCGQSVRPVCP